MREFAISLDAPVEPVLERCAERGIAAGYPLGRDYPEYPNGLLVALTERRSRRADRRPGRGAGCRGAGRGRFGGGGGGMTLTETPQQRDRAVTIFEKSKPGRRAAVIA